MKIHFLIIIISLWEILISLISLIAFLLKKCLEKLMELYFAYNKSDFKDVMSHLHLNSSFIWWKKRKWLLSLEIRMKNRWNDMTKQIIWFVAEKIIIKTLLRKWSVFDDEKWRMILLFLYSIEFLMRYQFIDYYDHYIQENSLIHRKMMNIK